MRTTRWLIASTLCSALLLTGGPAPAAEAKRVRVFAVGPKFDLTWVQSRETFRAKMLALFDRAQRGRLPASIQAGADDVATHLLPGADNDFVAWPEDIALFAVLTGTRGELARRQGSLTESIAAVLASHADLTTHYYAKFPELANRPPPPTRALFIAATDTFARVGVETFAEIADTYDVWLEAGFNMARDWRVVCVSKAAYEPPPGAGECEVEDAALVARLRAPDEPDRDYAYEATTPDAHNMALLFDPAGRIHAKTLKAYPTPTEAPGLLDLKPGPVSGVTAIDTPVGRMAFVTSRDAFMPDVTHKLDQQHVELLVQPEFFVNDIVRTQGMWAPDTLKSSGFSALQRHPAINTLVLPETTGNVYEFDADAQSHIAVKPRGGAARGGLVGQPAEAGFVKVQPWVVPDPVGRETWAERRLRLGRAGEAVAPGSGVACPTPGGPGPCEAGQVEGVLFHDISVGEARRRRAQPRRRRGRTPFTVNRPIAPSRHPQRNVALASRGSRVWAAYEERRGAQDLLRLVRSGDGGRTWSRPRSLGAGWWPSLAAARDGTLWLAWQDGVAVKAARSRDGGRTFSAVRGLEAQAPQWKPSIAALGADRAFMAWADERGRFEGEAALPRTELWGTRVVGNAAVDARRLDGGPTAELARTQDHAWAPSVAARGERVLVAWADVRTYDWRIYARESTDGGATFGAEVPVQDTPPVKTDPILPPENEALNDGAVVAFGAAGPLVAWTDFRKTAEAARRPHELYDTMLAAPGGRNLRADGHHGRQVNTFWPALLPVGRDTLVAWQDHARGPSDVMVARLAPVGRTGRSHRIDDSGRRPWNQWRPKLARLPRGRVLAAWEDERDGPPQIFAARAGLRRLR